MSYSAIIKELYSTENNLKVLSLMLVFSPGMFVSPCPVYYNVLCQTGNVFAGKCDMSC